MEPNERRDADYVCGGCGEYWKVRERCIDPAKDDWEPVTKRSTWCPKCNTPLEPVDAVLGGIEHGQR